VKHDRVKVLVFSVAGDVHGIITFGIRCTSLDIVEARGRIIVGRIRVGASAGELGQDFLAQPLQRGCVALGTDAAEHWVGWEPLKEDVQKMFDSVDYSKISIREQVIKISKSGDVAWFSEILDFQVEVQGEQVNDPGTRFTGVLEK